MDYDNGSKDIGDSLSTKFCAMLKNWGVKARIAERVKDSALMSISGRGTTFCIIQIEDEPIRWISIQWQEKTKMARNSSGEVLDTSYDRYGYVASSIEYGVHDPRLTKSLAGELLPQLKIRLVRIRILPLIGKVVNVHWKGNDVGLGVIAWLNQDASLKKSLSGSPELEITADYFHSRWIMSAKTGTLPSETLWNAYQSIARHMLAEWP